MIDTAEKISVVIPVYNEEEVIETVIKEWSNEMMGLGVDYVIKCFNDGSSDTTRYILDHLKESLPGIEVYHNTNSGHGPTVLQGYLSSMDGEWIFQVDSDNEISAMEFSKLWTRRSEYDLLIGKRDKHSLELSRRFISLVSTVLLRICYGSRIVDVNSPFRLMRVEAVRDYVIQIPKETFAPNLLLTGMLSYKKHAYLEIPVAYRKRQTGQVSIKRFKLFRAALRAFMETVRFRYIL